MKNNFIAIPFMVIIHLATSGQDISNSGFEDWSVVQYFEDPDGYTTTNTATYFSGSGPNVTRTTDAYAGTYALRLETIHTSDGVLEGAAFIGEPGEGSFTGGIPYNERPDSLTGYAKFNVSASDTAYVAAIFKKFGVPIGVSFAQFTGIQNNYQYFSVPVEWLVPIISPDTLAIALISSSIFTEPIAGSLLVVDQVQFVGPGNPFPNGNFESWTDYSSEEADHWQSTNILTMPASTISVSKTSDSHTGNFAIRMENNLTSFNDTIGFITNGTIGKEGPIGGMPVDDIPEKLSGYYKYAPSGPDSAIAMLKLYHFNTSTGGTEELDKAFIKLPAADDYTYFELPVDYYSLPEPDTVNIAFGSGNFDEQSAYIGLGSTLYIDDLEITYKPHIVAIEDSRLLQVPAIYPNPVRETLRIEFMNIGDQTVEVVIYNAGGKKFPINSMRDSGGLSASVNSLPAGVYFYRIIIGEQLYRGKFIVE